MLWLLMISLFRRTALSTSRTKTIQLVQISNKAIKEDNTVLEIWHLKDDGTKEQVDNFEIRKGSVYFEADGFSVYVIIEHEGGEVVTPRVEFHFIAPQETVSTTIGDIAYYTSSK